MKRSNRSRAWDKTPQAAEYRQEYNKKNYVSILLSVKPEVRDFMTRCADRLGISRTELITRAVIEYDERH